MKHLFLQCTIVFAFTSCSLHRAGSIQQSVTENGGYSLEYKKLDRDTSQLRIDLLSMGRWLTPDSSYISINDEEKILIGDRTYEQVLDPLVGFLFVEASSFAKVKEETRLIEIREGYDIHIVFYLINENALLHNKL